MGSNFANEGKTSTQFVVVVHLRCETFGEIEFSLGCACECVCVLCVSSLLGLLSRPGYHAKLFIVDCV